MVKKERIIGGVILVILVGVAFFILMTPGSRTRVYDDSGDELHLLSAIQLSVITAYPPPAEGRGDWVLRVISKEKFGYSRESANVFVVRNNVYAEERLSDPKMRLGAFVILSRPIFYHGKTYWLGISLHGQIEVLEDQQLQKVLESGDVVETTIICQIQGVGSATAPAERGLSGSR